MDDLPGRLDVLEHQVRILELRSTRDLHRLRWWRRLAGTLAVLTVFSLPLSLVAGPEERRGDDRKGSGAHPQKPKEDHEQTVRDLLRRFLAMEQKLKSVTSGINGAGLPELVITGANLRIVNGLGRTDTTNGVGNLIVGYNEERKEGTNCFPEPPILLCEEVIRTGSHNIVVGVAHNFSRFGGLVIGLGNEISGAFASVSGGQFNTASGFSASVSGGDFNRAIGAFASVSGGDFNTASAPSASVSGGKTNTASSSFASVSGGFGNTASSEPYASVSGGQENTASGAFSSVSGGFQRTAPGENNWAAGPLFADF
jgi:hypothetical protein